MLDVEIVAYTPNPVEAISISAGTSYGKDDVSAKRMYNCFQAGHTSVLEHASVTFRVSGLSRACSHQLVRHRLASFVQKSQRYTKIDPKERWYVTPSAFWGEKEDFFEEAMRNCEKAYLEALEMGVKPEDARFMLPEACKTEITVTMNARELFSFLDLRQDRHAQWEIRKLAYLIEHSVSEINDGWAQVMSMRRTR